MHSTKHIYIFCLSSAGALRLLLCSGGLELLFGNKKQHDLDLPENSTPADGSSKV
jgi:hypothetical protein